MIGTRFSLPSVEYMSRCRESPEGPGEAERTGFPGSPPALRLRLSGFVADHRLGSPSGSPVAAAHSFKSRALVYLLSRRGVHHWMVGVEGSGVGLYGPGGAIHAG